MDTLRRTLTITLCAAIALLSACKSSTEPETQPQPEPQPEPTPVYAVTVSATSIDVAGLCEEFGTDLDGGEFAMQAKVKWPDGTEQVLASTPNYDKNGYSKFGVGSVSQSAKLKRNVTSTPGTSVTVTFTVTEYDFDLFGNNQHPDDKMNHKSATDTREFTSSGWDVGQNAIDVKGSGNSCDVRFYYQLDATKI